MIILIKEVTNKVMIVHPRNRKKKKAMPNYLNVFKIPQIQTTHISNMRSIFQKKHPQMRLQPKSFWKTTKNQTRNKLKKTTTTTTKTE